MPDIPPEALARLAAAPGIWLFLDYDGTLAEFAPTPDDVRPDAEVIALLARLAAHPRLRVAVISGRRLDQVRRLVPLERVTLAGAYGLQVRLAGGRVVTRARLAPIRPVLDAIRAAWQDQIAGRAGYFIEDKRWTLALHARYAPASEAEPVLDAARRAAEARIGAHALRLLGGERFLEVAPRRADKGEALRYLMAREAWPGALPVYLGDDDKDAAAFGSVRAAGGLVAWVGPRPLAAPVDLHLETPRAARAWLARLPGRLWG